MNVRPLHDRIIVQRIEEGEQRIGGIIIPDTAKEKPQQGAVVAAGPGRTTDDGTLINLEVKVGQTVIYSKYAGTEYAEAGTEYLIVRESDILAIVG